MKVVVVGAGISGLAVATFLVGDAQEGPPLDVTVLEAADRPGGVAWSERRDGRLIETGPSSWLSGEPALDRLISLAGLRDDVLQASPAAKARWIWRRGEKHPVPAAPPSLLGTRLLSGGAKLRLLGEPFVGRGPAARGAADVDETVAAFAARRLGPGVVDALVAPMVAGIYGADPRQLSVAAAFPKLAELERDHRSLLVGAIRSRDGGPRPQMQTVRDGAGALTRALAARLPAGCLQLGQRVTAVERKGDGFVVHCQDAAWDADAVVLTSPAFAQAAALRGLDPAAARALDEIPYAPIAVATVAWAADAFPTPPDGFGVLVAGDSRDEVPVLGTVFVSATFPDHAAPGELQLRTLIGGTPDPGALDLDDQALLGRAHAAHAAFLGAPTGQPTLAHLTRHARAIPQYTVGHGRRVAVARSVGQRHPGLFLAGSHLDGPGVRDCARVALAVATRVRTALGDSAQV
ncbi:MAG: protoporphyrinogen oxidase [Alphaproteobacteria bacterium]|nr:protoporphyrinogen oxidase [Alphaproteobacteria bacterium]